MPDYTSLLLGLLERHPMALISVKEEWHYAYNNQNNTPSKMLLLVFMTTTG